MTRARAKAKAEGEWETARPKTARVTETDRAKTEGAWLPLMRRQ
jgi:hypothetical protein